MIGIDEHIGARLKALRSERGLNQEVIAGLLGVDSVDVASIEDGVCRLSASLMFLICDKLDVPMGWFFVGYDPKAITTCGVDRSRPTNDTRVLLQNFQALDGVGREALSDFSHMLVSRQRSSAGRA